MPRRPGCQRDEPRLFFLEAPGFSPHSRRLFRTVRMRVACIEPAFCSFVQCFCPNEPLHLASVENPPVKTAEMILKKSTCFLSFPDCGATARDHSCTSLPSSHLVSRTFSHRLFGLRACAGGILCIFGISFCGALHLASLNKPRRKLESSGDCSRLPNGIRQTPR